jgi:hypothetical protein
MISAIALLNQKGEVVISRLYRSVYRHIRSRTATTNAFFAAAMT